MAGFKMELAIQPQPDQNHIVIRFLISLYEPHLFTFSMLKKGNYSLGVWKNDIRKRYS